MDYGDGVCCSSTHCAAAPCPAICDSVGRHVPPPPVPYGVGATDWEYSLRVWNAGSMPTWTKRTWALKPHTPNLSSTFSRWRPTAGWWSRFSASSSSSSSFSSSSLSDSRAPLLGRGLNDLHAVAIASVWLQVLSACLRERPSECMRCCIYRNMQKVLFGV